MNARPRSHRPAIDRLTVALGPRSYDILIGEGLIAEAGQYIRSALAQPRVIVVTDERVAALHLASLQRALDQAGIGHDAVILPAGEQTKDFAHLEILTGRILDAGVERTTPLVALGGGVIGDLTGFAAAITLRGLPFVQVPTTLLAQVDSSVGGKTGINTRHGKNLVGAFHQPLLVLADVGALDTLARRELLAGYAEVVKYGLVNDAAFFTWLEANGRAVLAGGATARRHAIKTSCAAKAAIVAEDETEKGARALLNLGHTFGHALEAEAGYGEALLHGEAVAIGMIMAFRLSAQLGLCAPDDARRVERHFDAVEVPTRLGANIKTPAWTADRLLAHMAKDKKVQEGKMTFILARGIGEAFIARDVPMDAVRAVLESFLGD